MSDNDPKFCLRCREPYGPKLGPCGCFRGRKGPVHKRWSDKKFWQRMDRMIKRGLG